MVFISRGTYHLTFDDIYGPAAWRASLPPRGETGLHLTADGVSDFYGKKVTYSFKGVVLLVPIVLKFFLIR